MNLKSTLLAVAASLATATPVRADYLPNNFWPNAAFESGTNLDAPDGSGELTGWVRSGSDPTICQVTTNNFVSPTHSIMVNDNDANNYGEWDYDLSLIGLVNAGEALNLRYYQLYSVSGGEMRVTVLFFDANDKLLTENHFTVTGDSPGWQGSIESSSFTKTSHSLAVPAGTVRMQVAVVSGGSEATTGVLVVDDLSIARIPTPRLLAGNFWPNATFESGTNMNSPAGTPTGWLAGGSQSAICQVTTNNFVSSSHALVVDDNDPSGYGEWDSDLPLSGLAGSGDILSLQWFELYSVASGQMRVSATFLDSAGTVVQQNDFTATGQSPGWQGAIAGSGFTQRNQTLVVPPGAATLRMSLASGGAQSATGVMLIDDLSVARPTQPVILTGNFWPNPRFELGTNLDTPEGVPAEWARAGSDTTICQVSTNFYSSPTHALALVDLNTNSYGEWDSELALSNNAASLDVLDIQYSELHSLTNGQMRLSVLFFDAGSNVLSQTDFSVSGQSIGWQGPLKNANFTLQQQQVLVPNHAARMRIAVVSGGADATTGVLYIDDLSVARHPVPPTVLAGNFFPNPTFEEGSVLDDPALAAPSGGWQKGGNNSSIDQVTTNNFTSPTHSLVLLDNDDNGYGEWYTFVDLAGLVTNLDAVDIQWFQMYSTSNGNMRLSFAFLDSEGNALASKDFNTSTGQSAGWAGSISASSFEQQTQRLEVPAGATQLRVNFASGGSLGVTGIMVIDDLSVRLSKPQITGGTLDSTGFTVTWNSMSSKTYTVLFSKTIGPSAAWTPLVTGLTSAGLTTSYLDAMNLGQSQGFYRVIQE